MDHRRFLAHPEAHRPFTGGDLFARIGGRAAIDKLVDGLYDGIEVDAALRPLFGRDLATERESQKRFFTDWLGGEGTYPLPAVAAEIGLGPPASRHAARCFSPKGDT